MKTSSLIRIVTAFFLATQIGSIVATASTPVYFELDSRADIDKGDARGVSIADNGTLALAPTFDSVFDTKQTYIWSSAADASGNVYLGTGHDGRIFAVNAQGVGRQLADTDELDVTALAVDPSSGVLYAGTSPDGKVYRIAADGSTTVYFDPEDKYIWSLAVRDGVLYAGTGEKGIIYKVTAAGKGEPWVDTDEVHVVALTFAPNGDLIAGTDPNSLVLRIGADGKPFTLLDSPLQETHAVRVGPDGSIYALAIGASAATTTTDGGSVSVTESNTTSATKLDLGSVGTSAVPGRRDVDDAKSALFRILPDGTSDVLWSSKSVAGYSLLVDANRALIGTGDRGRIVSLNTDTLEATLLVQSTEDQTSTLVASKSGTFATSNSLGKLFRIGPGAVATGTYESPVHDAKAVSTWGRFSLRGSGTVTVEARSGNTETPDSTWSSWAPVALTAGSGPLPSPASRYLQWKLTLTGSGSTVAYTAVSYLPRNYSPDVTLLVVLPAGIGLQELPQQAADPGVISSGFDPSIFGIATNLPPRRVFQTGARSMIRQAKDPESDRITYNVYFRLLKDTTWHPLATALSNNYYTIDSGALPDGVYVFKVVADDAPSNPAGQNRSGERVSEPIEIDNTPPAVTAAQPVISAGTVSVSFDATDATSRVVRGDYAVDGGPWLTVYPDDGIPDSGHEGFKVRVGGLGPGEHVISFRAVDSNVNIGSTKVTVVVR